jgi:hypothetical protein
MSVRNWAKYMKDVVAEELQRPYYGVVTTISVVPDPKSQFKINFAFKELVNFDAELWAAMKKKTTDCAKEIVAPYPHQAELDAARAAEQQKAPAGKGKPGGKTIPIKPVAGKPGAKAAPAKSAPAKKATKY